MSDERTCYGCRFGALVNTYQSRCGWVVDTQDEAGDRMPGWAWDAIRLHPDNYGPHDRAETCAAFEERPVASIKRRSTPESRKEDSAQS